MIPNSLNQILMISLLVIPAIFAWKFGRSERWIRMSFLFALCWLVWTILVSYVLMKNYPMPICNEMDADCGGPGEGFALFFLAVLLLFWWMMSSIAISIVLYIRREKLK
jgi:hypothetical protein